METAMCVIGQGDGGKEEQEWIEFVSQRSDCRRWSILPLDPHTSAGFSGIIAKTLVAPIERVKLLLQTQKSNTRMVTSYRSGLECLGDIYRREGFISLWRGNAANVLRYFPNQALNFALKDKFRLLAGANGNDGSVRIMFNNFVSGGAAGATSSFFIYPLDVSRTRMATDVLTQSGRQFSGVYDCISQAYQEGGVKRVYRGFSVSILGAVLFRALFLGGYDNLKYSLDLEGAPVTTRYFAAQALTTTVGTLCYPIDTIKRRMMIQVDFAGGSRGWMNGRECLRHILHTEGWRGLFSGLSVNLVRGISGALLLVFYDEAKKSLN